MLITRYRFTLSGRIKHSTSRISCDVDAIYKSKAESLALNSVRAMGFEDVKIEETFLVYRNVSAIISSTMVLRGSTEIKVNHEDV